MIVGVLLATYNRKEQTLLCLQSLYNQRLLGKHKLEIFLTEGAFLDSSVESLKSKSPKVNVYNGTGSSYRTGVNHNLWDEALKVNCEFYLLLDEDTILDDLALYRLLSYYKVWQNSAPVICVGSIRDKITGKILYGGQKFLNKKDVQSVNVYSDTEYLDCDMSNSNIMLIPKVILNKIGMLSGYYTTDIASFDYSLNAKKAGFKTIVVPGVLGYCIEDYGMNLESVTLSLKERIKFIKRLKGLPYKEYLQFLKLHFPLHLPVAFLRLWIKALFPITWDKVKS